MARLVDDLLDVSRVARGKVRLQRGRLDLVPLVRGAAEDHRSALEEGRLTLDLCVPEGPVWVQGDSPRLAQVIGNLLTNAGKFTDAGGRVTVKLEVKQEQRLVVVTVADTGVGLERDMLDKVFGSYVQSERSVDRSRGGLGLGLALVRGLVELHGGQVGVRSAGPGQGSEFWFSLPLDERSVETPPVAAPSQAPGNRLRVLLIENNRDVAESLRMLLELSRGYEVKVSQTAFKGLDVAREFHPEVIVCGLHLPKMNGIDVARAVRNDPLLARTRLVAVSGDGDEERQRYREAGFDQAITTPIEPDKLAQVLTEWATSS